MCSDPCRVSRSWKVWLVFVKFDHRTNDLSTSSVVFLTVCKENLKSTSSHRLDLFFPQRLALAEYQLNNHLLNLYTLSMLSSGSSSPSDLQLHLYNFIFKLSHLVHFHHSHCLNWPSWSFKNWISTSLPCQAQPLFFSIGLLSPVPNITAGLHDKGCWLFSHCLHLLLLHLFKCLGWWTPII